MVRPAHVVRVFTRGDVGGNLLGVVNDTVGLSDEQMQAIAADLGFSETTFVDWGDRDVPMVRIFTPLVEMEFAGHPMVGTAWVMNRLGPRPHNLLECAVGEVDVTMDGETVWIETALNQPVDSSPDLAVLDRNILELPASELLRTQTLYTFVDGRIVFNRAAAATAEEKSGGSDP